MGAPECGRTEDLLRAYQRRYLGGTEDTWSVRQSPLGGRGLFATGPLRPGDVIFRDRPVVAGSSTIVYNGVYLGSPCPGLIVFYKDYVAARPRAKPDRPMCASCHRVGRVTGCPGGCYLPVCSPECSISPLHILECRVVREYMNMAAGSWRLDLLGTVAPLRCLFLDPQDREVIQALQVNRGVIHGIEVDVLKQHMGEKLSQEDEDWMRLCCCAMDANAFEFLKIHPDGGQTSLRGLYPLAAIMNHDCSPNSCHVYDAEGTMRVFAARDIAAGEEITTSYTALLWSTAARRLNLSRTKHFLCRCARCADPTEFGSLLSCLSCVESDCHGLLLPVNPLQAQPRWLCDSCGLCVSPKQAVQLQVAQGAMLQRLDCSDLFAVARFLSDSTRTAPPHSQVVLQLKQMLLWQLGHTPGYTWEELSDEMLHLKEQCCRDTMVLLNVLRLGLSRMRGLVLLELHAALGERLRRNGQQIDKQAIINEMSSLLKTTQLILQHDAAAQKDFSQRAVEHFQITKTSV